MTDTSGPTSSTPFASYDPESSSWRTSPGTSRSASTRCSLTLPAWGSLHGGALYERPTPAHLTDARGSSSLLPTPAAGNPNDGEDPAQWQARHDRHADPTRGAEATRSGMPTPQARDGDGRTIGPETAATRLAQGKRNLDDAVVAMLPTPRGSDATRGPDLARPNRPASGGPDLVTVAERLLPTPRAGDNSVSGRAVTARAVDPEGWSSAPGLEEVAAMTDDLPTVAALMPTPTATDATGSRRATARTEAWTSQPGTTLTDAAWIAGGRTPLPSSDGNASPGDPPPSLFDAGD